MIVSIKRVVMGYEITERFDVVASGTCANCQRHTDTIRPITLVDGQIDSEGPQLCRTCSVSLWHVSGEIQEAWPALLCSEAEALWRQADWRTTIGQVESALQSALKTLRESA